MFGAFIFLVFLLFSVHAAGLGSYNSKYDSVDLDQVLHNDRLFQNYVKCLLNEGPCTPDGKMLKERLKQFVDLISLMNFSETLPEAMETGCEKCTEKQRIGSKKVMDYIFEHRPEDWKKMEKIYDPKGAFQKRYNFEKEHQSTAKVTTEIDDTVTTVDPNEE